MRVLATGHSLVRKKRSVKSVESSLIFLCFSGNFSKTNMPGELKQTFIFRGLSQHCPFIGQVLNDSLETCLCLWKKYYVTMQFRWIKVRLIRFTTLDSQTMVRVKFMKPWIILLLFHFHYTTNSNEHLPSNGRATVEQPPSSTRRAAIEQPSSTVKQPSSSCWATIERLCDGCLTVARRLDMCHQRLALQA